MATYTSAAQTAYNKKLTPPVTPKPVMNAATNPATSWVYQQNAQAQVAPLQFGSIKEAQDVILDAQNNANINARHYSAARLKEAQNYLNMNQSSSTPLFPSTNPIQDKLDAAVQPSLLNRTGLELQNAELNKEANQVSGLFPSITDMPRTQLELIAKQQADQAAEAKRLQEAQHLSGSVEQTQADIARGQMKAATAGTVASLAQGREGPQSAGTPLAITQYKGLMQQRQDILNTQLAQNQMARENAQRQLQEAQRSDNIKLAQSIQSNLVQLEQEQAKINANLISAASEASAEARAVEAAKSKNIDMFMGWMQSGESLSPTMIQGFAGQTGLDSDLLLSTYALNEAARTDKTLSTEEKQQKIASNNIDLQRKLSGLDDEKARRAAYLSSMYKNGKSKEEIAAFKELAGITDRDDPAYILDQKIKALDYQLKAQDLTGSYAPGSTRWIDKNAKALDLAAKQREYADLYGAEYDPDIFKIGNEVGWCGDYASTISTASKVGDTWAEKREHIDDQMPSVGDKLLLPLGVGDNLKKPGHVAVVIGYDPATGDIKVAESNKDNRQGRGEGLGVATFGTYNVNTLNSQFGKEWGVVHGELKDEYKAAIATGQAGQQKSYTDDQKKILSNLDPKKIDANTMKVLKQAKLTTNDLLTFTPESQPLSMEKRNDVEAILSGISDLKNAAGLEAAVGAGLQKTLTPWMETEKFIPGTDAANFAAKFKSFRDTLTLPALDKLKGAMSDKDIAFLRNASTSLSLDMDEEQFKNELAKLEEKFSAVLSQGGGQKTPPQAGPIDIKGGINAAIEQGYAPSAIILKLTTSPEVGGQIAKAKAAGWSDEEIIQYLKNR